MSHKITSSTQVKTIEEVEKIADFETNLNITKGSECTFNFPKLREKVVVGTISLYLLLTTPDISDIQIKILDRITDEPVLQMIEADIDLYSPLNFDIETVSKRGIPISELINEEEIKQEQDIIAAYMDTVGPYLKSRKKKIVL